MKYLLVGSYLASLLISEHDDKEACFGRKAMLSEEGAIVDCVPKPQNSISYYSTGGIALSCTNTAGISVPCR